MNKLTDTISFKEFELDSNYVVCYSNKTSHYFLLEKSKFEECKINEVEKAWDFLYFKYDHLVEFFKDYQNRKIDDESFGSFEKRIFK